MNSVSPTTERRLILAACFSHALCAAALLVFLAMALL